MLGGRVIFSVAGQIVVLAVLSPAFADDACRACHARAVDGYLQTGMGNSISRLVHSQSGSFEHEFSRSSFEITTTDSGILQSVTRGALRAQYPIEYVIGSGNAAFGYLVRIDDYLYHLHQLAGLRADLDGMDGDGAGMLDSWRIEGEIASLRRKLRGDVSADLQRQFQDAIDQYEGHLRSVRALAQRRDLIDLRTKSAASALQQIAVDVSRLKSTGVPLPLPSLRERARELSTYVEDLQSGYRQLDQQRSVVGSRP